MVDAQRGDDRVERRGNRRRPLGREHVELDVAVATRVRRQLVVALGHHLGREVGQDRRCARVFGQHGARRRAGARAQIQKREGVVVAKRQQARHQRQLFGAFTFALLGLRREGA